MEQNSENFNEVETTSVSTHQCGSCGSQMKFDIEYGVLACGHCQTVKLIDNDDAIWRRELTDEIMRTHTLRTDGTVVRCQGCGSTEVLDRTAINKICNFCGNTSVVATEDLCGIQPDGIIPFTLDKAQIHQMFANWMKSRPFAPGVFKRTDVRERLNPIYIPSWSFSAEADGFYDGTLGRRVMRQTRNRHGQIITSSVIRYFRVNGVLRRHYTDYLIQSSKSISPINFKTLNPFSLGEVQPYRTDYLAGIPTEHYSRLLEDCFKEFTEKIKRDIRRDVVRNHHADLVQTLSINLSFNKKKFNYILLPIYIAHYKYRGKTYNFYVNGTSGKIVGKYPVSFRKIGFLIFGVVAALAGAVAAYYFLF
ncbi:MAG: hypothetical protein FWC00_00435 [Firmicutes bacterium]|nr:hypothetical protein [Bacillota bacterium]